MRGGGAGEVQWPALVSSLEATATQLEELVRGLEPDRLESCDVLRALEVVARLSKLAEAGRTVLAGVVHDRGLHARSGHLSAAHLLAATAGTSVGEAAATIETSHRLGDQDELAAAFLSGELSLQQATVISEACRARSRCRARLARAVAARELAHRQGEGARGEGGSRGGSPRALRAPEGGVVLPARA